MISKEQIKNILSSFDFPKLFNELGWERHNQTINIQLDDKKFVFEAAGHKRGMIAFVCAVDNIPEYNVRKKIEQKVAKQVYEHLLIFADKKNKKQKWLWVKREKDKPNATREEEFNEYKTEALVRKIQNLEFTLDEEEGLTLFGVTDRVKDQFDVDKITKKFYDSFKNYKDNFQKFIEGIAELSDLEWYTSLMMNRLMFIYFIQKKGFLDNNTNYLNDRLTKIQKEKGKDKFFTFYKDFLRILFHGGLGTPEDERTERVKKLVGKVPYLNGGLFDEHSIEKEYPKIHIPDSAFEKIFKFFDEWQWTLDDRPSRSDKEINPEVIGYIFEKYINQKQMGAYYTKEDITEYISKNTIIPFIFEQAKKECQVAFKGGSAVWQLLKDNADRYIYDAVRHGTNLELPGEIKDGLDTTKPKLLERRKPWNKPAPQNFALPTEIWREVVDRRNRYFEIKKKIEEGEISYINDFITYNLNIRQFAEDVIENCEGPELLRAIYYAIAGRKERVGSNAKARQGISILDPTCGSGAFLFAALNILEPLYEACIERMNAFVEESNDKNKFKDFREILNECSEHPSRKYFIFKSIILNNLYGVDIMNEAVEIAKLRLFLKLISEVENFEQIEALPDIDFNIRCGNTLVGFATFEETKKVIGSSLDFENTAVKLEEKAEKAAMAFERFKQMQIARTANSKEIHSAKEKLQNELTELNDQLNVYLGSQYGKKPEKKKEYENWKTTHQPFHWWVEYYNIIMNNKGFDVVIGNPPYVEYSKVKENYSLLEYTTMHCNNLFAFCIERSLNLLIVNGKFGMIVPLSSISTVRMSSLVKTIEIFYSWISNYAERPSKLFEGAEVQLSILLISKIKKSKIFTTSYIKWNAEFRKYLFNNIFYIISKNFYIDFALQKAGREIENCLIDKIFTNRKQLHKYFLPKSRSILYFKTSGGRYWKVITTFPTEYFINGQRVTSSKESIIYFNSDKIRDTITAVLNSNLFWYYYTLFSNLRDLPISVINNFPLNYNENLYYEIETILLKLMRDLKKNSIMFDEIKKNIGHTKIQKFNVKKSKPIIDEIDKVLAKHYGFTEEELDFIINYDIKYRMGSSGEEE